MPRSNFYSFKKWLSALGYLTFVFLFGFIPNGLGQNSSLACHSALQISLDGDCEAEINGLTVILGESLADTPDDFLVTITNKHGGGAPFSVFAGSGSMMTNSNTNVGEYIRFTEPGEFIVSVERKSSGVNCWGYLYVEYKLPPSIDSCACPDTATVVAEECRFSCILIDKIYQNAEATDSAGLNPDFAFSCADYEEPTFWDELVEDSICGNWYIIRTWKAKVTSHNGITTKELNCKQKFLFEAIEESDIHPPKQKVIVDCGVDTHPDSLLAYFSNTQIFPDLNRDSAVMCAYPYIIDSVPGYKIVIPPVDSIGKCLVEKDSLIKFFQWFSPSKQQLFSTEEECDSPDCELIWIQENVIIKTYEDCIIPGSGEEQVISMTRFPIGRHLKPGSIADRCKITATYRDTDKIPICGWEGDPSSYKFVRTWHVINWCTNETYDDIHQIIKVVDTLPPTFTVPDSLGILGTDPWTCAKSIKIPSPQNIDDNCTPKERIEWKAVIHMDGQWYEANGSNNYTFSGLAPGEYDIEYIVYDECENELKKISKLIIEDHAKPIVITKKTIIVSFSEYLGECSAKVFPYNIDIGSYDACDGDWVERKIKRLSDVEYGDFVKFTEADITNVTESGVPYGEVNVELKVTDKSGNYSIGWTTVRLEDKNTKILIDCGDDEVLLECTADLNEAIEFYKPTVLLKACDDKKLDVGHEIVDNQLNPKCNTGWVYVEYQLSGDSICLKKFHLGDIDTVSVIWPDELVIASCSDEYFGDPIIDNKYCNLLGESVEIREFSLPQNSGYCKKIIREFTIIDWCQYKINSNNDTTGFYQFNQVIKIKDEIVPEITCDTQYFDAGPGCLLSDFEVVASATDGGDCASESLDWEARLDINGDGHFEYELDPHVNLILNEAYVLIDTSLTAGQYTIEWKATDECGNTDIQECIFVIEDVKAPTPVCIGNVSTALMNTDGTVTIWANDFDPNGKSFDDCGGPVYYSFSDSLPDVTSITFDCFDITNGVSEIIQVPLYVWDESGNRDFCYVNIRLDDHADVCIDVQEGAAVVTGSIWTEEGERVESAEVELFSYTQNYVENRMTDISGDYAFFQAEMHYDYRIVPSKNDDFLNGVSTFDLLLIQRHILGLDHLSSAYKVVAGDVNNDRTITALDLVELRRLVLGITNELSNNTSWRFIDANQDFEDPLNPWPLNEEIGINDLPGSTRDMDFIAIKVGDVNGNAIANSLSAENRNRNQTTMMADNRNIEVGQIEEVVYSLDNPDGLYGFQFSLSADEGQVLSVESNVGLTENNLRIVDGGVHVSWHSALAFEEDVEIRITFQSDRQTRVSKALSLDKTGLRPEVYSGAQLDIQNLNLTYGLEQEEHGTIFDVYQNNPNPWSESTTIGFVIPESGRVDLNVFDITGKQIFELSDQYYEGSNTIELGRELLESSGVLYYRLNFKGHIATRKMILID